MDALQPRGPSRLPSEPDPGKQIVALAMRVVPAADQLRTQGILVLRRDGLTGLALDARHAATLASLRLRGARLAEIELAAFEDITRLRCVLPAMINAIREAAQRWDTTDVVTECARGDAAAYCRLLGFRPLSRATARGDKVLLGVDARHVRAPSPAQR